MRFHNSTSAEICPDDVSKRKTSALRREPFSRLLRRERRDQQPRPRFYDLIFPGQLSIHLSSPQVSAQTVAMM